MATHALVQRRARETRETARYVVVVSFFGCPVQLYEPPRRSSAVRVDTSVLGPLSNFPRHGTDIGLPVLDLRPQPPVLWNIFQSRCAGYPRHCAVLRASGAACSVVQGEHPSHVHGAALHTPERLADSIFQCHQQPERFWTQFAVVVRVSAARGHLRGCM